MPSRMTETRRRLERKLSHASRKSPKSGYANPPKDLASLVRGMYGRVAHRLHIDPSYVSRVARGERKSELVDAALRRELNLIVRYISKKRHGAVRTSTSAKARKK